MVAAGSSQKVGEGTPHLFTKLAICSSCLPFATLRPAQGHVAGTLSAVNMLRLNHTCSSSKEVKFISNIILAEYEYV